MKERRSIVIVLSFFVILFCIGFGIFLYIWFLKEPELSWNRNYDHSIKVAQESNMPIILAITKTACGETEDTICPDPNSIPDLKYFILINSLEGSNSFQELVYDDRFERDMEELPKFFLLNADGEIRDVRSTFPDKTILNRWKEIN